MSLFVESFELQRAPGAVAVEVTPPVVIEGVVLGYLGYVFAGEWGPVNVVGEPSGTPDFLRTYFPPGSPHTSQGYIGITGRKRVPIRPVRITKNAVVAVTTKAAGAGTYTATAKHPGVLGNSIALTWKAPTDGVAAHRDLEIVLTNATTGVTRERLRNVVLGTSPDCSASILLASLVFSGLADALPAAETTENLGVTTAGSDGDALTATEYTAALALLAVRGEVAVVCTDNPGNSLRADVNDAVVAHVVATRNRLAVVQSSNPSETWANVKTYVNAHSPSVRSDRVLHEGAWVQVKDDAGVAQTTPFATFIASALCNLEPQQSHAWWDDRVTGVYNTAIAGIVAPFSTDDEDVRGEATDLGIGLPIRLSNGAYASLHDRTSSLTSGKRFTITRRLKDFFAKSITAGIQSFVNGTNWRGRQLDVKSVVDEFLGRQDAQARPDDPRLVAWSTSIANNTPSSVAAGNFLLAFDGQTPSVMEKIGLMLNVGEGVTVRETT